MERTTRAPTIFGGALMLVGSAVYLADVADSGRNLHLFVVPAVVLMAIGALFTLIGTRSRSRQRTHHG